ncbi:hypothetical protein ACFPYI_05785 [Halomarina salina]|uniref:Uncharacterized protein n=1 Tax=Halomarina salina TaxID=1872699 RepID=A0ABD5RKD0_9EURY|nr:hypothetical protein [Halomarina salina]
MPEQLTVKCAQCGTVYSARKENGQFVLTTGATSCSCGSRSFVEYPRGKRTVVP